MNIEPYALRVTLADGRTIVVPKMSVRVVNSPVVRVEVEPEGKS